MKIAIHGAGIAGEVRSSFAPKTRLGITFRDLVTKLLRIPALTNHFVGRDLRDDLELPDDGF